MGQPADQWPGPRRSADLAPTGEAAVEETGSATFLDARVVQVRVKPQTVGAALTNAATVTPLNSHVEGALEGC